MLKILTFSMITSSLVACDSSPMAGDVAIGKNSVAAIVESSDYKEESTPSEISPSPPQSNDAPEEAEIAEQEPVADPALPLPLPIPSPPSLAPEALPPVSISGAYLNCLISESRPSELDCSARDGNGNPSPFKAKQAYILSGNPVQWKITTFVENAVSVGRWQVNVLSGTEESFGVALADERNQVLVDWVEQSGELPPLQLRDGSFEDQKVDTRTSESMRNTQYLAPEAQGAWKAKPSRNSRCRTGTMEVQSLSIAATMPNPQGWEAAEGEQWTELDSACTDATGTAEGGNMAVYQDLSLVAGHIYEISFSYKHRPIDTALERFSVRLGDQLLFDKTVTSNDWAEFKTVRKLSSGQVRLEFEELGVENGMGVLIDDVRVLDLGTGP